MLLELVSVSTGRDAFKKKNPEWLAISLESQPPLFFPPSHSPEPLIILVEESQNLHD